ncbi:hypothetical protein [Corynebacterium sp. HS2168-gen11]|uniref:hypothetical protein n=1 Tax=Corynebacterium sp. HS2168-gen11 TaxID=2974027 RepID=UPI00216AD6D1|nr:hypothetical protein [Corynebacterium sp. HS2168-gen11]MCS4535553.1 hypothetical protein [Corynebacterium sp. HS2168-gen11]
MRTNNLFQQVADEAQPPAVLGRYPGLENFEQVLLDDLVTSNAWLPRELKEPFLALWVNEPEFDDPDLGDPIEELDYNNVHAFAAMDPVVDLESLREPKTP